jgi:DNA (cytosine-5)-methyltransferase 1
MFGATDAAQGWQGIEVDVSASAKLDTQICAIPGTDEEAFANARLIAATPNLDWLLLTKRARDLSRGVDSDCTDTLIAHSLRGEGFDASEDGTGRGTPIVPVLADTLRANGGRGSRQDKQPMIPVAFNWQAGGNQSDLGMDSEKTGALHVGQTPGLMQGHAVRRLTPRECERLQGFHDDYTMIPWHGKTADQCPDGPRYKALGNSMAVPVMRWIGERIAAVDGLGTR